MEKTKKKKKQTLFVVQYNDCYGNGNSSISLLCKWCNTNFEVIVKNKTDFKKWLKKHNAGRDGMKEKEEEFTLIPLNLFED